MTGTFDDWGKTVRLEKKGNAFEKLVRLPEAGQNIYYKVRETAMCRPGVVGIPIWCGSWRAFERPGMRVDRVRGSRDALVAGLNGNSPLEAKIFTCLDPVMEHVMAVPC